MITRPEILGFSFSQIQCEYLGLNDWKAIYQKSLELKPDCVRIAAYGNRPKEETHYLIKEAQAKDIWVILAVGGIKYFRWPEFFPDEELGAYLKEYPQKVLGRDPFIRKKITTQLDENLEGFGGYENVKILQVGNESLNIVSVAGGVTESQELLEEQVGITRQKMRPDQQLLLTCSFPVRVPPFYNHLPKSVKPEERVFRRSIELADIVGINDYTKVPTNMGYIEAGKEHYRRVKHFKKIANEDGIEILGIEVQGEPWEEGNVVHIAKRQYPSCYPERMVNNVTKLAEAGLRTQILWGVEHWQSHAMKGNIAWVDAWERLKTA